MFSVTPRTQANSQDILKTRRGASPKQEADFPSLACQCDVSTRHVQENGYGPSPDKTAKFDKDRGHYQYEHGPHPERPKTFDAPLAVDSIPKGGRTRTESDMKQSETRKTKDAEPHEPKTGNSHSEVTKIVPLKPQRSKKSLNKENTDMNPQNQSQPDGGTADVHMTKSKDGRCKAGRRADDNAAPPSARENKGLPKHQSKDAALQQVGREPAGQQELRDSRGQSDEEPARYSSELKENLPCGTRAPTAPPRTLPLRTQWSRDRQGNVDTSHIHHRPSPGQDASKRKQAVKKKKKSPASPAPPSTVFLHHGKSSTLSEHCMSLGRQTCFFDHLESQNESPTYLRTHVAVYEKAKVHLPPHCIIGPRELFAFPVFPPAKA